MKTCFAVLHTQTRPIFSEDVINHEFKDMRTNLHGDALFFHGKQRIFIQFELRPFGIEISI